METLLCRILCRLKEKKLSMMIWYIVLHQDTLIKEINLKKKQLKTASSLGSAVQVNFMNLEKAEEDPEDLYKA